MEMSVKYIKEKLLGKNIKPSHHRIRIFQYLALSKFHPTVEMIYNDLIDEIPTLSKTTVYNTLNIFVKANLVRVLSIDEVESRYDITTESHGHFLCKSCGKIYDFEFENISLDSSELKDFQTHEKNVYFSGICSRCFKDKKNHQEVINE